MLIISYALSVVIGSQIMLSLKTDVVLDSSELFIVHICPVR